MSDAAITSALGQLEKVGLRAEQHDAFRTFRVEIGPYLHFDSPEWEIVYGIPGSGKTIMLKAWEEEVLNAVERPLILPVYISARQILDQPGEETPPAMRGESHFHLFLEEFGKRARASAGRARTGRSWVDRFVDELTMRHKDKVLAELTDAINHAVQRGRPVRRPREARFEEEEARGNESQSRVKGRIRGGLSGLGARIGIGGAAERLRQEEARSRERLSASGPMAPDFARVTELIDELAETLGIERFCVLLDDWSLIDTKVQPWVGAWLLRTLGGNRRIAVKIASNFDRTRLWDEDDRQGFDVGVNIRERPPLDEPRMSPENLVAFYERLLFKRLASRSEAVEAMMEDRLGRPSPEFVAAMFAEREAFEVLAKGTEGIPRNFLAALGQLIDEGLPEEGWTVAEARAAVGLPEEPPALRVNLPPEPEPVPQRMADIEALLEYVIRHVVVATRSRYFLVRKEDGRQAGEAFDELLELNLIHPDSSQMLPEALRDQFDGYWLSEERWRRFGRALMFAQELVDGSGTVEESPRPVTPHINSLEAALPYVLDFTRWRA